MNPLRTLENTIAGLVEGTFGRVFRSEVRPMELARKLVREMDEHRTVSVSRVYVPNEYSVWLSPQDRDRYEGVEHQVIDELCAYLLEHARREELILASRPVITFHTDEQLALGEFGIQARLVHHEDHDQEPPHVESPHGEPPHGEPEHGHTMIYSTSERLRRPVERARAHRRVKALLVVADRRLLIGPRGAVVGRSRTCDVVLEDAAVSRRHAEISPRNGSWTVKDLGSTNGVRVNGLDIRDVQELRSGDRIELGSTEILFEVE